MKMKKKVCNWWRILKSKLVLIFSIKIVPISVNNIFWFLVHNFLLVEPEIWLKLDISLTFSSRKGLSLFKTIVSFNVHFFCLLINVLICHEQYEKTLKVLPRVLFNYGKNYFLFLTIKIKIF